MKSIAYQKEAIEEVEKKVLKMWQKRIAAEGQKSEIIYDFSAPTGSGKTYMMAKIIEALATWEGEFENGIAIIFIAPNKLHHQGGEKIGEILSGKNFSVFSSDAMPNGKALSDNSVMYINWSSLNKKSNKLMTNNEEGKNLQSVMSATHKADRAVILFIDESHHTANTVSSREVMDIINPDITLNFTATPKVRSTRVTHSPFYGSTIIKRQDVVDAKMIVWGTKFNSNTKKHRANYIKEMMGNSTSNDDFSIYCGVKTREELSSAMKNLPAEEKLFYYEPMMGIQLSFGGSSTKDTPGEISSATQVKKTLINTYDFDESEIAIYLSGQKENLDGNNIPFEGVKIVIFKAAISLGWDCPPMKVGVLLANSKNPDNIMQLTGRFVRQPHQHHYVSNDDLNYAYMFTSSEIIPKVVGEQDVPILISEDANLREGDFTWLNALDLNIPTTVGDSMDKLSFDASSFSKSFIMEMVRVFNDTINNDKKDQKSALEIIATMGFENDSKDATSQYRKISEYEIHEKWEVESDSITATEDILSNSEAEYYIRKVVSSSFIEYSSDIHNEIIKNIATILGNAIKAKFKMQEAPSPSDIYRGLYIYQGKGNFESRLLESTLLNIKNDLKSKIMQKSMRTFSQASYTLPKTMTETRQVDRVEDTDSSSLVASHFELTPENSTYLYDIFPVLSSEPEKVVMRLLDSGYSTKDEQGELAKVSSIGFMKNGDHGKAHFAYPYKKELAGGTIINSLTYPDFLYFALEKNVSTGETKKVLICIEVKSDSDKSLDKETLLKYQAGKTFMEELKNSGTKSMWGKDTIEIRYELFIVSSKNTINQRVYKAKNGLSRISTTGENAKNWDEVFSI